LCNQSSGFDVIVENIEEKASKRLNTLVVRVVNTSEHERRLGRPIGDTT
jgi:hypothetical protein